MSAAGACPVSTVDQVNVVSWGPGTHGQRPGVDPTRRQLSGAAGVAPMSLPRWRSRWRRSEIAYGAPNHASQLALERGERTASIYGGAAARNWLVRRRREAGRTPAFSRGRKRG